jgi:hypothetical protein
MQPAHGPQCNPCVRAIAAERTLALTTTTGGAIRMICAHTVRKVKPGQASAFIEAFTPSADQVPPSSQWVRFFALQGQGDPDTVVTFGFFEGTRDEMEASQADQKFDEHRRSAEEQFVDQVISNDVYDVVVHLKPQAVTTA